MSKILQTIVESENEVGVRHGSFSAVAKGPLGIFALVVIAAFAVIASAVVAVAFVLAGK